MNDFRIAEMEKQLHALQKAAGRLRKTLAVALGLAVLVFIVGFQPAGQPGIIEARQFVLKDKDGKVQAKLHTNVDNLPSLSFYDKAGSQRMELYITEDEVGLHIDSVHADVGSLASLSADHFGTTMLMLHAPDGRRISLVCLPNADDRAEIMLWKDGKQGQDLTITAEKDELSIELNGEAVAAPGKRAERLVLATDSKEGAAFEIVGKNRKQRLILESDAAGNGSIQLFDENGKPLPKPPQP